MSRLPLDFVPKSHFNFFKNNHARIQAKMGAAGPASARLNAAWTTQSRSRGGDPKDLGFGGLTASWADPPKKAQVRARLLKQK